MHTIIFATKVNHLRQKYIHLHCTYLCLFPREEDTWVDLQLISEEFSDECVHIWFQRQLLIMSGFCPDESFIHIDGRGWFKSNHYLSYVLKLENNT